MVKKRSTKRFRREGRFLVQQRIAVGVFALLTLAILVYLSTLLLQDTPSDEFVEGEHYQLIDPPRRIRGEAIEVIEFFSYACVHCYNFDPDLADWVADQVEQRGDKLRFSRMPLIASDQWRRLGRHYYAMENLGQLDDYHMLFFRAIHDNRQTFKTPEELAEFFPVGLVNSEDYALAYRSPEVASQVDIADKMARRLQVSAVPTVVIQGKYLVRTTATIGLKRMLDVMSYLLELESATAEQEPNL